MEEQSKENIECGSECIVVVRDGMNQGIKEDINNTLITNVGIVMKKR